MKKSRKHIIAVISICLAAAVAFHNGAMAMVMASGSDAALHSAPGIGDESGSGGNGSGGETGGGGGNGSGGETGGSGGNESGNETGGEGGNGSGGETGGEDGNESGGETGGEGGNGSGGETGEEGGNGSGGETGEEGGNGSGENGGSGETEDDEIEEDVAEGEHVHTWEREPGELYAFCTECGEQYTDSDCDPDGIGIHIYEWVTWEEADDGLITEKIEISAQSQLPVDGDSTQKPVDGDGTQKPADGDGTQKPADGDSTQKPADGDGTQKPADGDSTQKPADGDGAQKPADGDGARKPADGDGTQESEEEIQEPVADTEHDPAEGVWRCVICGYEKAVLDPWDLTLEEYMMIAGIATFATTTTYGDETSLLPTSYAELAEALKNNQYENKTFDIQNRADLLALQKLSEEFSFDGWTVQFMRYRKSANGQSTERWDLTEDEFVQLFQGLGTEEHPFKGTLRTFYSGGSLHFTNKVPLLNYVAAGASVSGFEIQSTINVTAADAAVGVIAAHVMGNPDKDANGNAKEVVHLSDITIEGSVSCANGSAGVLFGEVTDQAKKETLDQDAGTSASEDADPVPVKLQYNAEKDKLALSAAVTALNAGTVVGTAKGENISVYDSNVVTSGRIKGGKSDGSGSAGMLAGTLEEGTFRLGGDNEHVLSLTGYGRTGGMIGYVKGGNVLREEKGTLKVTGVISNVGVSGSGNAVIGGIVGRCENTKVYLTHVESAAALYANNAANTGTTRIGGVLGQFVMLDDSNANDLEGKLEDFANSETYSLIDQVKVSGYMRYANVIGGVVGAVSGHNLRIGDPDAGSVVVTSPINDNRGGRSDAVGGVIGLAVGQYIEVSHAQVSSVNLDYAAHIGGVFGRVNNSSNARTVVRVKDTVIRSSTANGANDNLDFALGGIFGKVEQNCLASLDGAIDVDFFLVNYYKRGDIYWGRTGYIAGAQTNALIYFEKDARGKYKRQAKDYKDDIGNYGGVYWNRDGALISYAEKQVTGSVSGGQLTNEADVMRLAIALNTDGWFAANCFGGTDNGGSAGVDGIKRNLLAGTYSLSNRVYDLADSGIYDLNKNDHYVTPDIAKESFTGQIVGNGATLKFGSCDTYQHNVALFPYVGNGAVFENFTLERTINYAKNAAGLAVSGTGNVTVKGVKLNVSLAGTGTGKNGDFPYNIYVSSYKYGGMFATFQADAGTVLTVENCALNGQLKITYEPAAGNYGNQQYVGGMMAQYSSQTSGADAPRILVKGLTLRQQITSTSRYASGMITQLNAPNFNGNASANKDKTILKLSDITIQNGSNLTITDAVNVSNTENLGGGFLGREWLDVAPCADHYSVKNLTVGGSGSGAAPALSNVGKFGGMINTVTGRIQLVDTKINSMAVKGGKTSNDGLLINKGCDALVEIDGYDIGNVTVTDVSSFDEIVGRNIGQVAPNGTDNNWNWYTNGGIVNIISKEFKENFRGYRNQVAGSDKTASNMTRYYYNIFGDSLEGESTFLDGRQLDAANLTIADPEQMLIWHLNQYMNDSIRVRYLKPYFANEKVADKNKDVKLLKNSSNNGRIDLKNVSYYPTPVESMTITGEGVTVAFYADIIERNHDEGRRPSVTGDHYMMHGGLLLSRTGGAVTVQGSGSGTKASSANGYFTLEGTVADLGENSGALFVRSIVGNKNIYWLRIKDLYINGYKDDHTHGLLIGRVGWDSRNGYGDSADINMSWLETEYTAPVNKKAASALIGRVGFADSGNADDGSRDISIEFSNMKLDDQKGGVFAHATLIDQYYYTDNTKENRGRIRYLFTRAAAEGKDGTPYAPFNNGTAPQGDNKYNGIGNYITIGDELRYGIEYWDEDGDIHDDLLKLGAQMGKGGDWDAYLPYVCGDHPAGKEIEVNPKTQDILEGCGVYEDPYVLTSARQLLALARYLTNPKDSKYLDGWQINQIGTKNPIRPCDKSKGRHIPVKYEIVSGALNAEFPTQDELRRAYYQIEGYIDLSSLTNTTDRNIAQEFVGLGTEEAPFAGVIVGVTKKGENGKPDVEPRVTLPLKNKDSYSANFGLVQYAKGAVVKELTIDSQTPDPDDRTKAKLTDRITVRQNAGAVFACVLGGDNIIDNVVVANKIALANINTNTGVAVGGYVGTVQQGSVILRNLSEKSVRDFSCMMNTSPLAPVDQTVYPYLSGLIGKVENGYVLYEDADYKKQVIPHDKKSVSGVYSHHTLPVSRTYDIIAAGHSDMAEAKKDQNLMDITGSVNSFACTIHTSAQLQLVSMAINSDSFSVYGEGGGYDRQAVCRKAQYSDVGCGATTTGDYTAAISKDDDKYWYPYIYDYFKFNDKKAAESSDTNGFYATLEEYPAAGGGQRYRSKLNAVTKEVKAAMTWNLADGAADVDYDLSGYKRGFRGLGATYRIFRAGNDTAESNNREVQFSDSVYSDFRANFDGHDATVRAEMINDYEEEIHTTALFNDLVNVDAHNSYTIQNLVVTGIYKNRTEGEKAPGTDNTTFKKGAAYYSTDRTAAVVGLMRRPWTLKNITVQDVIVDGPGFVGGVVAWISPGDEDTENRADAANEKNYALTNCKLTTTDLMQQTAVTTVGGTGGGIVGAMSPLKVLKANTVLKDYSLTLDDCHVGYVPSGGGASIKTVRITNEGAGLLGVTYGDPNQVWNSQYRYGRGRTGGLIGFVGKRTVIDSNNDNREKVIIDTTVSNSSVSNVLIDGCDSTGGVLGEYFGYSVVDAPNDGIPPESGEITLKVENVDVTESSISSQNINEQQWYAFGVGGIVGKVGRMTGCRISGSNVKNSDVKAQQYVNKTEPVSHAGGVVGTCYYGSRMTLSKVTVEGNVDAKGGPVNEISSFNADAGGLIGRNIQTATGASGWFDELTDFKLVGCQVHNMNILSDNRQNGDKAVDKASGTSGSDVTPSRLGCVGGMIGTIYKATVSVKGESGKASLDNCTIRTGARSINSAGGVIGQLYDRCVYTVDGITVLNSRIGYNGALGNLPDNSTNGAGGIFGKIHGNANRRTDGNLKSITVENCTIFGKNTGGLAGYVDYCQNLGNEWAGDVDEITIFKNQLLGKFTGGAIGCLNKNVTRTAFEHLTISENKILSLWNDSCYAGGFCGYGNLGENNYYNKITVENNQIMSRNAKTPAGQSAGGVFGYIYGDNGRRLDSCDMQVKDNHIGYGDITEQVLDGIEGQMTTIGTLLNSMGTKYTAKLLKGNAPVDTMKNITKADLWEYAGHFGNLVGTCGGANMHVYFTKPTVSYSFASDENQMRPVTDVGWQTAGAVDDKNRVLKSDPYAYRKNIHVIYNDPDDGMTGRDETEQRWNSVTGGMENLFSRIPMKKKVEDFTAANESGTWNQMIDAYRLNHRNAASQDGSEKNWVTDTYDQVYYGADAENANGDKVYRSPLQLNGGQLPMIVLDAQYGTADQLMGNVLAILTNSGGVINSGEANPDGAYDSGLAAVTGITCKRMKVQGGSVLEDTGGKPSLVCTEKTGRKGFEYAKDFDQADDSGNGTFTMVTVTYGKPSYPTIIDGKNMDGVSQITINIPVFVTERLTIDTYIKLVEGAAFNVENAKKNGIDNDPLLATDSAYTMYVEYIYGKARKNFSNDDDPLKIEKTISMKRPGPNNTEIEVPFAKGTVFTLIDVCDSNRVYYYTVTGEETGPIEYTMFTDADGKPYDNKAIHEDARMECHKGAGDKFISEATKSNENGTTYTESVEYEDVAVERFLIVVDAPKGYVPEDQGQIRTYHVSPKLPDNSSIVKRTTVTEHSDLKVTVQKGMSIGFVMDTAEGGTPITKVDGNINQQEKLVAEGQFIISASEEYWNRALDGKNALIDSANHGKFLDLDLYLTVQEGEGADARWVRVPLPDNTNVTTYLERLEPISQSEVIQEEKNLGAYVNQPAVYVYKDGRLQFPLDDVLQLIEWDKDQSASGYTSGKEIVKFKISLDFEGADLTDYVGTEYGVILDLLRMEDPDYPAGGEVVDSIESTCDGPKQSDVACALEAVDQMQLGINTYDNQSKDKEEIDFRFKLDFSGIWPENPEAQEKIAARYYTVTYHLLEKQKSANGGTEYVPYTGNQLELSLVNPRPGEILKGGSYNNVKLSYVSYLFTKEEIEKGITENGENIPLVVSRDLRLTVNGADTMDLTNYKVLASVMVSDMELNDIQTEINSELNDFLVFTVGKLKTDMDY